MDDNDYIWTLARSKYRNVSKKISFSVIYNVYSLRSQGKRRFSTRVAAGRTHGVVQHPVLEAMHVLPEVDLNDVMGTAGPISSYSFLY